jgi:hypothetical protein
MSAVDTDHLAAVLADHFDPKWGSRFWLDRRAALPFDPLEEVREAADLQRFGPMPIDELATRPVTDFIPQRYHDRLHTCVTSETGGTTGPPKRTAFLREEFEAAFVTPFLQAAEVRHFPKNLQWLFIGPSGPHVIGKAARACAVAMGSIDPFSVDFDPRWVRRLAPGSLARRRYMDHVIEQSGAILQTQDIGVLFATPPVLTVLGNRLPEEVRARIRGIHLGGLPGDRDFWARLCTDWFPNAVAMSGYGNSLAGVSPQLDATADGLPIYFSHGPRLILFLTPENRVGFHRIDHTVFLPNVIERDAALPATLPAGCADRGFQPIGIAAPGSPDKDAAKPVEGLY